MDEMKGAINNAIALVKDPVGYMTRNKNFTTSVNSLMINYVAIIALIPLIARLIGDLAFYRSGLGYAIGGAILSYILDLVAVFIIGYIIWKLAPSFQTSIDQPKSTVLAAYVYTPVFLIGILSIIPALGILSILGVLYGIYILYRGIPILLNTPPDKVIVYTITILVAALVVSVIISAIIGAADALAVLR
jgi:hypothetical protein